MRMQEPPWFNQRRSRGRARPQGAPMPYLKLGLAPPLVNALRKRKDRVSLFLAVSANKTRVCFRRLNHHLGVGESG